MKKLLCLMLTVAMLLSLLPGQALAVRSESVWQDTEQITYLSGQTVSDGLTLADGNHQLWVDRVANLPDYAETFYGWLEDNATATGALADPTLATNRSGSYVYPLDTFSGTVGFTYSAGDDMMALAKEAALAALAPKAQLTMDYAVAMYSAFDRDHPEVFWLSGRSRCGYSYSYGYNVTNGAAVANYSVTVYFYLQATGFDVRSEDFRDTTLIADAIAQRDADVDRILADCPDAPAAVQVQYLNKVLTETNAYNSAVAEGNTDAASEDAWRCTSALAGTSGTVAPVCEGYARAFKVLCDELEIPCVLTEGVAKATVEDAGGGHMWNYVQIDGGWYAVDVTWNDPYVSWDPEAVVSGYEYDKWLLLGSETQVSDGLTYIESHAVDNTVTANGIAFNNGPVLEETAYVMPENLMDVSAYRSGESYTAPVMDGYVFGGWYTDAAMTEPLAAEVTTGYAYAKFVDAELLTVKWQITKGTTAASATTDLRLLTSVDALTYNSVSFNISIGGVSRTVTSNRVYETVKAGDVLISNAAGIFGPEASYFVTFTLTGISQGVFDTEFTIIPGWETLDGTQVSGTPRTLCICEDFL